MDASLLLAIDGLREVAHAASEVIIANAGDDEKKDRSAFAIASDAEVCCLAVLGAKLDVPGDDAAPARRGLFDAFSMLPGMPRGGAKGAAKTAEEDADAAAAAADAATSVAKDATAMKRAVTNAQLAPITDIVIVHSGDPLPPGFQRVSWSVTGMYPADLNAVRACARGEGRAGPPPLLLAGDCDCAREPLIPRPTAVLRVSAAVDRSRPLPHRPPCHGPLRRHARARGVHPAR